MKGDNAYRVKDISISLLNEPLSAYYTKYQPMMSVENTSFNDLLDNKMRLVETIHIGISYDLYFSVASLLPFTDTQWAELLGISAKSLTRYKTEDAHVF
jgi:hypothetical protein